MIDAEFARAMARYNAWQNKNLHSAAAGLSDAARRENRGAFFGSIHGTLSHLLWADTMWMCRFTTHVEKPDVPNPQSPNWVTDWADLSTRRAAMDETILAWANALADKDLSGDLTWFSGDAGAETTKPRSLVVTHFFNHQTHHRGQVHAMLTAAGAKPDVTDLMWLKM